MEIDAEPNVHGWPDEYPGAAIYDMDTPHARVRGSTVLRAVLNGENVRPDKGRRSVTWQTLLYRAVALIHHDSAYDFEMTRGMIGLMPHELRKTRTARGWTLSRHSEQEVFKRLKWIFALCSNAAHSMQIAIEIPPKPGARRKAPRIAVVMLPHELPPYNTAAQERVDFTIEF